MTGTASSSKRAATAAFADPNDNNKRQRFAEWGAQVAASIDGDSANIHGSSCACPFCGRHHSLAVVYKTSSLSTNHVSLQLAVESPSHLFIKLAPGGPRNPRSSVLVRVSLLPTWVRAEVGATVQLGAMDITAGAARPLGARSEMTLAGPSNVWVSSLTLPLVFILTTSLCPRSNARGDDEHGVQTIY